jgi:K+/H+ antiporter YhaU regulatory subunit KhtT
MTPQSVPMTAWEQAVIVALFSVFVIALITVLLVQFGKQQKDNQAYIAAQQKQIQEYLDRRDANNQEFFRLLRRNDELTAERTAQAMGKMTDSLNRLNDKFDDHDRNVESRITRIAESAAFGRRHPGGGM